MTLTTVSTTVLYCDITDADLMAAVKLQKLATFQEDSLSYGTSEVHVKIDGQRRHDGDRLHATIGSRLAHTGKYSWIV